jgi:hypothetical protein
MNSINIEKQVNKKVIPHLPPVSVIIVDSSLYHGQEDKPFLKTALRKVVSEWLRRHVVVYDMSTRKVNLFTAVEVLKLPKIAVFTVEEMLYAHGDALLRTLHSICDFNSVELVQADIKYYVRSHSVRGDMSIKILEECVSEGHNMVSAIKWSGFCKCVISLENKCWVEDGVMEVAVDSFVVNLGTSGSELSNMIGVKRTLVRLVHPLF